MIHQNIKQARRQKGLSQQKMAERLHVVRQTVSKWETGRSVPDVNELLQIAALLEIPAGRLLGTETEDEDLWQLTEEITRLNEEIEERNEKERRLTRVNQKRGLMILLSFMALIAAMTVKNEIAAILLIAGCMLVALVILHTNLALLTENSADETKLKPLRWTTVFDLALLAITAVLIVLRQASGMAMPLKTEKWIAAIIASAVMLFGGYISPRLPYNRHTGLRLPWTLQDEEAWNTAHKVIGCISIPCVLLNLAANMAIARAEIASILIMALWIAVPSVISLIWFLKKYRS